MTKSSHGDIEGCSHRWRGPPTRARGAPDRGALGRWRREDPRAM